MQHALIRDFRVVNIIEADEAFAALIAPEWQAVEPLPEDHSVAIGWGWEPGEPAPEPDPPEEGEPAEPPPRVPGTLVAPEQLPAPAPAPEPRYITRLAFLSRFTDAEAVAIDLASIGATVEAASMRHYMSKVNAATFIDLDRADTRAGVLALEAATLLAEDRALEILDAEIEEQEIYHGIGV